MENKVINDTQYPSRVVKKAGRQGEEKCIQTSLRRARYSRGRKVLMEVETGTE